MSKHDVIVQAVNSLKKGEFGVTGIKVELEAQFNRGDDEGEYCNYCDDGWVYCFEDCADGEVVCQTCDGFGHSLDLALSPVERERTSCTDCDGTGRVACPNDIEHDGGYARCDECHGDYYRSGDSWSEESYCEQFLLERLEPLGLTEQNQGEWVVKAGSPLVYGCFYRDGSVDSEFTFTIRLDDPENIFLLPKVIEAWNELGEAIGKGVNVKGAGMHLALIRNPDCWYGDGEDNDTETEENQYQNFRRSMGLLMPALFFLGSTNEESRGLNYRRPQVSLEKYSAITYRNDSLEFRVFNTCYATPEAILDNVVVMANCMKYWRSRVKPTGLAKITSEVRFGNDNDNTLNRFYSLTEHIDLLNKGLTKLKPSYYTIGELKKQRKFVTSKRTVKNVLKDRAKKAKLEYREYEERFIWQKEIQLSRLRAEQLERSTIYSGRALVDIKRDVVIANLEASLEQHSQDIDKDKRSLDDYVKQAVSQFHQQNVGQYTLKGV